MFTRASIWWPLNFPSFWLTAPADFHMDVTFASSIPRNAVFCIVQIQFVALWTKFLTLVFRVFSSIPFTSWQIRASKVWTHSKHNFCVEIKSVSKLILNCLSKFLEIFASNILLHQILESWLLQLLHTMWKSMDLYSQSQRLICGFNQTKRHRSVNILYFLSEKLLLNSNFNFFFYYHSLRLA